MASGKPVHARAHAGDTLGVAVAQRESRGAPGARARRTTPPRPNRPTPRRTAPMPATTSAVPARRPRPPPPVGPGSWPARRRREQPSAAHRPSRRSPPADARSCRGPPTPAARRGRRRRPAARSAPAADAPRAPLPPLLPPVAASASHARSTHHTPPEVRSSQVGRQLEREPCLAATAWSAQGDQTRLPEHCHAAGPTRSRGRRSSSAQPADRAAAQRPGAA